MKNILDSINSMRDRKILWVSDHRKGGDRLYLKTYTPAANTCSAVKFNSGKAGEMM